MSVSPRRIALMLDLQWPFKRHAGIFAGTLRYAEEQGWESIIDEFVDDTLAAGRNDTAPYDGVIARVTQSLAEQTARFCLPVVNVWQSSPVAGQIPSVFPDYQTAGRLRAEHLLARGLHDFAAIGCRGDSTYDLEIDEFCRTIRESGGDVQTVRVSLSYARTVHQWRKMEDTLANAMETWPLPIGVFVGAEHIGRVVVQKCRERRWRVPEDVALITGRNEETFCEHPRPSLTSLEMGYERVGYEAGQLLHRLMDGAPAPTDPVLLPPPGLVVRESTDFFAVNDPLVAAALEFISRNSHRRIGQDDVSRAVTAETRTLQLRFRKHLGRPIAAEIRRVRLERAKRELVQSRRSLAAIARDVGFGEAMRMYEVFRREVGIAPSEYRKQRQLRD